MIKMALSAFSGSPKRDGDGCFLGLGIVFFSSCSFFICSSKLLFWVVTDVSLALSLWITVCSTSGFGGDIGTTISRISTEPSAQERTSRNDILNT